MEVKPAKFKKSSQKESPRAVLSGPSLQKRKLKVLKSRLPPLNQHPIYESKLDVSDSGLLKWLAYCDNNAFLADAKIRACLEYRRKHNIDFMLTEYKPPAFADYYPGGICGVDKEGSPVYYELFGILNLHDIMNSSTREELITFKIYQHEKIIKQLQVLSRAGGKKVDTILVIVDMQQCNKDTLWNPALRAWAEIIEVLQDLYPGLVKEVLVINVHFIYPEIYMALRPYLSRSTLKLIKVMGQDYLKHLLQRIEKHKIPAFLGGYKCDYNNNPYCLANLNWNSHIPQFMHYTNKRMLAHVNYKTILGGEKCTVEYHVPTPKSDLTWEFYEISHPVMFSIYLNTIEDKNAVLPSTLISNAQNHNGSLMCLSPGRYHFLFDNCRDFAYPVTVIFKVEVKMPHDIMNRLAPRVSLGESINFKAPIGERELKARQELFFKYPYTKQTMQQNSST